MKVIYGIGISVTLGFGFVWLVCKLVTRLFRKANRPKTEPFFRGAQITGAAAKKVFMHLISGWRNNNKPAPSGNA